MTERGLPIVGGAQACPFVAFDDDRDERATSPDHRHRCYAEAQPAPRALAHQEAYCLSSAFPVCPTFQDWARREAARARPPDMAPPEPEDEEGPLLVDDRPPRRGSREAWAAPPPWLRGSGSTGSPPPSSPLPSPRQAGDAGLDAGLAPGAGAAAVETGLAAGGLSGSFADRLASDREAPAHPGPGVASTGADAWGQGSPAGPVAPPPGRGRGEMATDDEDSRLGYLDDDDEESAAIAGEPPRRRRERLEAGSDRLGTGDERDVAAPSWERPRRLEAYPTLRSRRWSTAVLPSVALGVIALLLAAAALFFVPQLLGIGGPPAASPTPPATASVVPSGQSPGPGPSLAPVATPLMYTVVSGDTMTKIANKFHVALADLIAANKDKYPDPNKIAVGDVLVIPASQPSSIPGASPVGSP